MRNQILMLLLFCSQLCLANEAEDNCLNGLYDFSLELPISMTNEEEQKAVSESLLGAFSGMQEDSLLIQGILDQQRVDSSYAKGIYHLIDKTLLGLEGKLGLYDRLELKRQFTLISRNLGENNAHHFQNKKIHLAGLTAEKLLFARCQALGKTKLPLQMPEKISAMMLAFSSLMAIIGLLTAIFAFYKKWRG